MKNSRSFNGLQVLFSLVFTIFLITQLFAQNEQWLVFEGKDGPGKGKHIVLVSGDEEYRSEEGLPMLAKILAVRHGFKCTVLFAINPETGEIDPNTQTNIPGLKALESADLMLMLLRFRELPDEQMKYIVDFTNSGKPIVGLRTSTHAFNYTRNKTSPYAKYDFKNKEFADGYGRQVLGETWVNHYGRHGRESTRGVVEGLMKDHPILKGVDDIWGPSDVYGIRNFIGDEKVLIHGQILSGMNPDDIPNFNKAIMPVAWIKTYTGEKGNKSRVFNTTMGASADLQSEGLRRLIVNACYWGMGMEDKIPEKSNVDYVDEYKPSEFGFDKFIKGLKPANYKIKP